MTLVLLHFTARPFSGLHAPSSDFITLPVHEHSKHRVHLKHCCESFYDSIYLTHVRKGVVFCVYECVSLFCVSLSLSENIYVCLLHIICACALHNTSRLLPRFLCLYDGRWRPARLLLALRTLLASLCACLPMCFCPQPSPPSYLGSPTHLLLTSRSMSVGEPK